MRICVVDSCGKKKMTEAHPMPECDDLQSEQDLEFWRERLADKAVPAREMYLGSQHREIARAVDLLRTVDGLEVQLYILSAGFGLLGENDLIPPYECSFTGMSRKMILERSKALSVPRRFSRLGEESFELLYLALGKNYLAALGDIWSSISDTLIVLFDDRLKADNVLALPAGNQVVKAFSQAGHKVHGAAGFKGDLLRILATHALRAEDPLTEIRNWGRPQRLRDVFEQLSQSSSSGYQTTL
ncbi:peroxide stress protein YaaA [Candidatus Thorarchaeota archaeon]|nr:MAG: peroxide stress protein YaaA [Candidatus Thorarchaeota archaeon]